VWIGTWGFGVWRFKKGAWTQFLTRDGLVDHHIPFLREAPNGDLWAASNGQGISRFRKGKWRSWYDDGAPAAPIRALFIDADGNVWASTSDRTLCVFDGRRWATVMTRDEIRDIVPGPDGRVWLVTDRHLVATRLK